MIVRCPNCGKEYQRDWPNGSDMRKMSAWHRSDSSLHSPLPSSKSFSGSSRRTALDDSRRQRAIDLEKAKLSEVSKLRDEIKALRESAQAEAQLKAKRFSFWLEAKRSEVSRAHHFKYSSPTGEQIAQAVIPFFRLCVLNEGTLPLEISAAFFWREGDQEHTVNTPHHTVIRPSSDPATFEASTEILQAIAGNPPFDLAKVKGEHAILVAIDYHDDGQNKKSEAKLLHVRISGQGTTHLEGEVSSLPFSIRH